MIPPTTRNFEEHRRFAALTTDARWVWLSRMPIDDARTETCEGVKMGLLPSISRNPPDRAVRG